MKTTGTKKKKKKKGLLHSNICSLTQDELLKYNEILRYILDICISITMHLEIVMSRIHPNSERNTTVQVDRPHPNRRLIRLHESAAFGSGHITKTRKRILNRRVGIKVNC